MILFSTSSADTYITNKIIDSSYQVSGNVGRAGTIDIFKLYDESSTITGSLELSRGLIKFDVGNVKLKAGKSIDLNSSDFEARLIMRNISTGQPVPRDFTLSIFPLSRSFDEGAGRDVISFADVDAANFLSSSINSLWNMSGANEMGNLNSSGIDIISSGNLNDGNGLVSLRTDFRFEEGNEDLSINITRLVSGTVAGILPDHGYRISFSESEEDDQTTRFVKRFASRHVTQQSLRPYVITGYNDSTVDHHSCSFFNVTGTLYTFNFVNGSGFNFLSGSSLSPITGSNCLLLNLTTGSLTISLTGSQKSFGDYVSGAYYAEFSLNSFTQLLNGVSLENHALTSGSIKFQENWTSLDGTVNFAKDTVTYARTAGSSRVGNQRQLVLGLSSLPGRINQGDVIRVRFGIFDNLLHERSSRFSLARTPLPLTNCKFRIRDIQADYLLFDFDMKGTEVSLDSIGNFFDLYTENLPVGIQYGIEISALIDGKTSIFRDDKLQSFIVSK